MHSQSRFGASMSKGEIRFALFLLVVLFAIAILVSVVSCGLEGDDRSPYCFGTSDPEENRREGPCEPEPVASASPSPSPELRTMYAGTTEG